MLIEDNPDHVQLVAHALGSDAALLSFADGTAAIAHYAGLSESERAQIAAIILDLKLGAERGLDVLSDIRARRWHVPVVVLTTSDAAADRLQAYERQANSYLIKPLNFTGFREVVRELATYWGEHNQIAPEHC